MYSSGLHPKAIRLSKFFEAFFGFNSMLWPYKADTHKRLASKFVHIKLTLIRDLQVRVQLVRLKHDISAIFAGAGSIKASKARQTFEATAL